jgi:hypothetical protein
VAALQALDGGEEFDDADTLGALCEQHGQADIADVLDRWARARPR